MHIQLRWQWLTQAKKACQTCCRMRWLKSPYGKRKSTNKTRRVSFFTDNMKNRIIDPVNHFRQHVLGLKRIHPSVAGRLVQDQAIPHTYFCSDVLVKRPMDWSDTLRMLIYSFSHLNSNDFLLEMSGYPLDDDDDDEAKYKPTKALKNVLHSSERLVYFMISPQTLENPSQFARDFSAAGDSQGLCILFPSAWQKLINPGMFRNVFLTDGAPDGMSGSSLCYFYEQC
jgi:hypothetical protein